MDDGLIRCPHCGKLNRAPAAAAGKTIVCGACKQPLTATGAPIVKLTDANFRESIGKGSYVVDFWAAWCGPCRMMEPVLDAIAASRNDVRIAKLNVDENPRTASSFGAQSIPLLVFFRDGAERGRLVGARPRKDIEAAIAQYLRA